MMNHVEKTKSIVCICMILSYLVVTNSPLFAESLAEEDNKKRRAPEENWLAKVAGAATAAGVAAVAYNKAGESEAIKKARPMSPEELVVLDAFLDRRGGFDLRYGYSNNFLSEDKQISGPELGLRMRLPGNFALSYANQEQRYLDGSFLSKNQYRLEFYLLPVISKKGTVQEIGAYVGAKGTKVIPTEASHTDFTYGLSYTHHDLNNNYSLSLGGNAAVVDWPTYTVDYTADLSLRYHIGPVYLEVGGTFDITDLKDLRTSATGAVGFRF